MGIREFINQRAGTVAAIAGVAVLIAFIVGLWTGHHAAPSLPITRGFFSDDDGKTWFTDDVNRDFPFDHNGRKAYRAYVFRCGNGKPFVAYLGRASGTEVKKPGDDAWMPVNTPEGEATCDVKCPQGGRAEAVLPQE